MPLMIQIITQERVVYDCSNANKIAAPSTTGQITILTHHSPLITLLEVGEVIINCPHGNEYFAVTGGLLQVADDQVIILARSAENAKEINVSRAQKARERAQKLMEMTVPLDEEQLRAIEISLRKAKTRLKVASHGARQPRRGTGPGEMTFGGE